ncbi:MAG TPA: hypothetical protein VGB11_06640, partial [Candidatus Bathyarchaeia archaeon]
FAGHDHFLFCQESSFLQMPAVFPAIVILFGNTYGIYLYIFLSFSSKAPQKSGEDKTEEKR